LNPVVSFDAALERQFVIHVRDVFCTPRRDLGKGFNAIRVQLFLKCRANALQQFEIIRLARFGSCFLWRGFLGGWFFSRRRLGRFCLS
jgi:hypothetical protein